MNLSSAIHSILNTDKSGTVSWTATQDCWCIAEIYATGNDLYNAQLFLDNVCVAKNSNDQSIIINFPVRKGQVFKKQNGNCAAKFYAVL